MFCCVKPGIPKIPLLDGPRLSQKWRSRRSKVQCHPSAVESVGVGGRKASPNGTVVRLSIRQLHWVCYMTGDLEKSCSGPDCRKAGILLHFYLQGRHLTFLRWLLNCVEATFKIFWLRMAVCICTSISGSIKNNIIGRENEPSLIIPSCRVQSNPTYFAVNLCFNFRACR